MSVFFILLVIVVDVVAFVFTDGGQPQSTILKKRQNDKWKVKTSGFNGKLPFAMTSEKRAPRSNDLLSSSLCQTSFFVVVAVVAVVAVVVAVKTKTPRFLQLFTMCNCSN